MHTMVLGFAGYSLLLSSCVALILLLRMGCIKDILKSPLHVLSTSDTLISMITSIILLINQSIPVTNFEQVSPIADANKLSNRELLQDYNDAKYDENQTCVRFYQKYNDSWADNQATNETTSNCTFQHILMHYAMFLVPFANAFMSLLIYSVQCSSGMSCVNEKCSSLTKVSQNVTKDMRMGNSSGHLALPDLDLSLRKRVSGGQEDLNVISQVPKVEEQTQETILTISNDGSIPTNSNTNPKFTGFGLITQWLVPILVTAILYFSKTQDMNNKPRESSEMDCIFKINFPLESCYKAELAMVDPLRNPEENYNELTVEVEDLDTLRISYPDSEAIEEVVSSVRNVVQSALNQTCNNFTELKDYNSSRPWNITKYITTNNITQTEMLERLTDIQQVLNNNDLGIFRNNACGTTNSNDSGKTDQETLGDEELAFFKDVVETTRIKTTSALPSSIQETKPQESFPQGVAITSATIVKKKTIETTPGDNTTEEISEENRGEIALRETITGNETPVIRAENVTGNSKDQIYANIIKRIRDTLVQVKAKGQPGNSQTNHEANRDNLRNSESISRSRKIREDRKISPTEYKDTKLSQAPLYMNERCFVSSTFLKVHLLILLFLIYFIPVLVSGILQTRAIYMCKNVLEKIETANKKNTILSQIQDVNKITINENPPPKPGWFPNEPDHAMETDSSAQFQKAAATDKEKRKEDSQLEENQTGYKHVLQETKSMEMLFTILTRSLMLGVLMWTPAFIEILSKVFLCASTPAWLVNLLYLLGVSFGIVKNFFNVNIARINKNINDEIYGKENSVHPSD